MRTKYILMQRIVCAAECVRAVSPRGTKRSVQRVKWRPNIRTRRKIDDSDKPDLVPDLVYADYKFIYVILQFKTQQTSSNVIDNDRVLFIIKKKIRWSQNVR